MIKVKVRNSTTDTNYESHLMTDAEADQWINDRLVRNSWGVASDLVITKKDMTAELEQKKAIEDRKLLIRDQLKAFKKADVKNLQDAADLLAKVIEHLGV